MWCLLTFMAIDNGDVPVNAMCGLDGFECECIVKNSFCGGVLCVEWLAWFLVGISEGVGGINEQGEPLCGG